MGYDLHLKRAKPITREEWRRIVAADAELAGNLNFRDGRISMKNPREADIAALVRLAEKLKAEVVGDDGERYPLPGAVKAQAKSRAPKKKRARVLKQGATLASDLPPASPLVRRAARESFGVDVYKRGNVLLVNAHVISSVALSALPEVIVVENPTELARAITEATRLAHAAIGRPKEMRVDGEEPGFWQRVGIPTWNKFVVGTTAISIGISKGELSLSYEVRDEESPGSLTSRGAKVEVDPKCSDEELARAVLELFAERESPEGRDDRSSLPRILITFGRLPGTLAQRLQAFVAATGKISDVSKGRTAVMFKHETFERIMSLYEHGDATCLGFLCERGPDLDHTEKRLAAAIEKLHWPVRSVKEEQTDEEIWSSIERSLSA